MLINEVAKETGLSKKAIRFYEDKGLLKIQRNTNGYRFYSEKDVETLRKIKLLRMAGVCISDVKLLFDNVISISELSEKRKKEIESEYGNHSSQYENCSQLIQLYQHNQYDNKYQLDETETAPCTATGDLAVGIDIGTTSISAVIIDLTNNRQVEFYTIPSNSQIPNENVMFCEQDTVIICKKVFELLEHITNNYTGIKCIGTTGQMHGILYVDKNGNAVSPLTTWQDKRADNLCDGTSTFCDKIRELSGEKISTGYGFATHYYNVINGIVPDSAHSFCSIMDYIVMKLTGQSSPLTHNSIAASFGLFDAKNCSFKKDKITQLNMDDICLPEITDEYKLCGTFKGIDVAVALGDNQASFLGSVKSLDNSILVNIGTGSQISAVTDYHDVENVLEIRPLVKDKFIVCGSALCGGASYALLENFFREYISLAGISGSIPQYETMNKIALETYKENIKPLTVNTWFAGQRNNPSSSGSIRNITTENFTPGHLILGFIEGMCNELYEMFKSHLKNKTMLIASGNAVQKITVMKNVIADRFSLPVFVSLSKEEASIGAALFSAVSAKQLSSIDELERFINYKE